MPKNTKKRKDKAADFSKAKLKLGKGKQAASNVIDTSFKARSIALPSQSIAHDKDAEAPSTKRRLTFDDLLSHLKHYNAGTRRDAILGLRELLETYPDLVEKSLTPLINGVVRQIGDEDSSVRKTLLAFLSWLLPLIPADDLIPHSPVLLLFTTSAQTHIFPEIRIDAIRFLDLFLEYIPGVVVEGWTHGVSGHGRRVLKGYLGILNAGTIFGEGGDTGPVRATSTASVVLSPGSKLIVLRSLSSFLKNALSSSTELTTTDAAIPTAPTWFLSSSFTSQETYQSFDSLLRPVCQKHASSSKMPASNLPRRWEEEVDIDAFVEHFPGTFPNSQPNAAFGWTLQDLTNVDPRTLGGQNASDESHPARSVGPDLIAHLARTLHSTLVSTFLDCAPTVFAPSSSPSDTELQLVLAVTEICRCLYGAILRDAVQENDVPDRSLEELRAILGYLSPYFPFTVSGIGNARRDIKVEQTFQELNLIYCELASFLLLVSPSLAQDHRGSQGKAKAKSSRLALASSAASASDLHVSRVSEYVVRIIRGEPLPGASQTTLSRSITPSTYTALLPTIWSLISSPPRAHAEDDTSANVLRVVLEHAIKASSTSAVKKPTVEFVGRLILLGREAEYRGSFRVGRDATEDAKLEEWILHLPRVLWELGGNQPPTTEVILRFLLRLIQRRSRLARPEVLAGLSSRLVPYFVVAHPTRGRLPGPYAKLPPASPVRRLALDVVTTLARSGGAGDGLQETVGEAVRGTEEEGYWAALLGVRL
ncbi:hypothetical protein CERSUDRAFT_110758 [Gelatoporia subvermispora B]|uniref:Pre-rRNA-processing protein n=1 Tax=Ceriporiopsis subvermispora (strain B) TaxID=914234 RepID=M2PZ63_CERS8|nr:hypothetical protein CERSUDRAFT_110758 [Gelatoporia subvermispora B]